jgi:ribosomal protein L37AE/L43A
MEILECPKCGKKTIAQRSFDLYQCIGCDFERDFASPSDKAEKDQKEEFSWLWLIGGAIATLLLI